MRKSSRTTKGKPPTRFKDFEMSDTEQNTAGTQSSELSEEEGSQTIISGNNGSDTTVSETEQLRATVELLMSRLKALEATSNSAHAESDKIISPTEVSNSIPLSVPTPFVASQPRDSMTTDNVSNNNLNYFSPMSTISETINQSVQPMSYVTAQSNATSKLNVVNTNVQPFSLNCTQPYTVNPYQASNGQTNRNCYNSFVPPNPNCSPYVVETPSGSMLPPQNTGINYHNNSGFHGAKKLIDLPYFDGNIHQWPTFLSAFRDSTAFYGYSHLENMLRLQKCLKGEAKETVESLIIFPDNVPDVMSTLEIHFGKIQHLISSQLDKIRQIPSITDSQPQHLISFATKVKNLVSILLT